MTTVQHVLKEYFTVRRWFLHHVLLGLLIGLIAGAALMWFVTDRYFDDEASATVNTQLIETNEDFFQPIEESSFTTTSTKQVVAPSRTLKKSR